MWQYDPADNAYTRIDGALRCHVWFTALGNWAAIISERGISTAAYNFATPEDAQTWCETQAAAAGRSTPGA